MTQELRYLVYEAWTHYNEGSPFPVNIFMDLQEAGVCPEKLHRLFDYGLTPPLASEYFDSLAEEHSDSITIIATDEQLEQINRQISMIVNEGGSEVG